MELGENQVQKLYPFLTEEFPQFGVVGVKLNPWIRIKWSTITYAGIVHHIMSHSKEKPKSPASELVHPAH